MKGENKHQENESVVEDIVPLPPYPIKTVVAEPVSGPTTTSYKTAESNESKRLQDILNSQIKKLVLRILKILTSKFLKPHKT